MGGVAVIVVVIAGDIAHVVDDVDGVAIDVDDNMGDAAWHRRRDCRRHCHRRRG